MANSSKKIRLHTVAAMTKEGFLYSTTLNPFNDSYFVQGMLLQTVSNHHLPTGYSIKRNSWIENKLSPLSCIKLLQIIYIEFAELHYGPENKKDAPRRQDATLTDPCPASLLRNEPMPLDLTISVVKIGLPERFMV